MLKLTLPYPPSVNRVYRVFKNRIIMSEEGRNYVDLCVRQIMFFMRNTDGTMSAKFPFMGRLCVNYDVYCPDKRARDLANLDKVLTDCITKAGVWIDDSHIDDIRFIRKPYDKTNPRVEATIAELTETT